MKHALNLFFDTSFLSEAKLEDIKCFLGSQSNKIFLADVIEEFIMGDFKESEPKRYNFVFDSHDSLKSSYYKLNLNDTEKVEGFRFNKNISLKESCLLCSAYYSLLGAAVNPAIPTDEYRHFYNGMVSLIMKHGDTDHSISQLIGKLRQDELNEIYKAESKGEIIRNKFYEEVIKSSRKKKVKELKRNQHNYVDYKIVTAALLFSCYTGRNCLVLTCDKDLNEIKENLIRSIIERYAFLNLLHRKIGIPDEEIHIVMSINELKSEVEKTIEFMKKSKNIIGFQVGYYDVRDGKIYDTHDTIPDWLIQFIVQNKANIDCFNISDEPFPYRYLMDPVFEKNKIRIKVKRKNKNQIAGIISDCSTRCLYSKLEKENFLGFSGFE